MFAFFSVNTGEVSAIGPYFHTTERHFFLRVLVYTGPGPADQGRAHLSPLRKADAWRHCCTLNSCQNTQRS